jgi:hypothetical protein
MEKDLMKKRLAVLIALLSMGSSALLSSQGAPPSCFWAVSTSFFNSRILTGAFSLYNVDQNLWYPITMQLQNSSQLVPGLLQQYAQRQNPNPLGPMYNPDAIASLLQQVLFEQFYQVMQGYRYAYGNNTINDATIQGMFNYLWLQHFNELHQCLVNPGPPPGWEGY